MAHAETQTVLDAQDLLAGSTITHEVRVPRKILTPGAESLDEGGVVRMRPLNVAVLTLVSRAAREDPSLIPLLMIKESLVEPVLSLDQIRQMHAGLVYFLAERVNSISGLGNDDEALEGMANSPLGQTHILLARHFGWTPEQVSQLTPGQVAVYLAGVAKLLRLEEETSG
ncbi:MAG TPA: hypothetical protein VF068_14175 [Rubrobacter sp.]